jgi:acetyl-CoA synthetase
VGKRGRAARELPPHPFRSPVSPLSPLFFCSLGTAEVESALGLHKEVAESAVVGFKHDIKGEGIYAFVVLKGDAAATPELKKELIATVRKAIGPIATPDVIHITPDLPKTRSGKIMRRILRKIASGEREAANMGDTTTLADPSIVTRLIEDRAAAVGAK